MTSGWRQQLTPWGTRSPLRLERGRPEPGLSAAGDGPRNIRLNRRSADRPLPLVRVSPAPGSTVPAAGLKAICRVSLPLVSVTGCRVARGPGEAGTSAVRWASSGPKPASSAGPAIAAPDWAGLPSDTKGSPPIQRPATNPCTSPARQGNRLRGLGHSGSVRYRLLLVGAFDSQAEVGLSKAPRVDTEASCRRQGRGVLPVEVVRSWEFDAVLVQYRGLPGSRRECSSPSPCA